MSSICSPSISSDVEHADFPSTEESLLLLHRFLENCNEKYRIPKKAAKYIHICSDEIVNNIVSYAHAEAIRICYRISPNDVILEYEDNGVLYDPLQSEAPDVTLPAKERQIGGLGLFMVRKIASSVEYSEANGWNRLKLAIRLAPEQTNG